MCRSLTLGALLLMSSAVPAMSAETLVAVTASFTAPAEEIAAAFASATGGRAILSFGATGALYAQITQGAPFAVFLAADDVRPTSAIDGGLGVEGTDFTYAIGTPVLYSPSLDVSDGEAVLRAGAFDYLAIAEPSAAPYGAAVLEVLAALGITAAVVPKLVTGESTSQTLQFIDSGNAELGFVARSQVIDKPATQVWIVPAAFHTPIVQNAVLLTAGADDAVARAFIDFLKGAEARAIIERHGYALAD